MDDLQEAPSRPTPRHQSIPGHRQRSSQIHGTRLLINQPLCQLYRRWERGVSYSYRWDQLQSGISSSSRPPWRNRTSTDHGLHRRNCAGKKGRNSMLPRSDRWNIRPRISIKKSHLTCQEYKYSLLLMHEFTGFETKAVPQVHVCKVLLPSGSRPELVPKLSPNLCVVADVGKASRHPISSRPNVRVQFVDSPEGRSPGVDGLSDLEGRRSSRLRRKGESEERYNGEGENHLEDVGGFWNRRVIWMCWIYFCCK